MNRTIAIVTCLLGAIAISCAGVMVLGWNPPQNSSPANQGAEQFATKAVTEIGKGWTAKAFDKYTNADYKRENPTVPQRRFEEIIRKKVGNLKSLAGWTAGNWELPKKTKGTVSLKSSATFEKGTGKIDVVCKPGKSGWSLSGFRITSGEFLK